MWRAYFFPVINKNTNEKRGMCFNWEPGNLSVSCRPLVSSWYTHKSLTAAGSSHITLTYCPPLAYCFIFPRLCNIFLPLPCKTLCQCFQWWTTEGMREFLLSHFFLLCTILLKGSWFGRGHDFSQIYQIFAEGLWKSAAIREKPRRRLKLCWVLFLSFFLFNNKLLFPIIINKRMYYVMNLKQNDQHGYTVLLFDMIPTEGAVYT